MPFDDTNIRKLVRYQLEKRIHFSRYKPLSNECKSLILSLLEPDLKIRMTISQLKNHDWINGRILTINNQEKNFLSSQECCSSIDQIKTTLTSTFNSNQQIQ